MCGIAGFVDSAGVTPGEEGVLRRMIGVLAHRGPDGTGVHLDAHAALAHARLSIIDLEGGAQPIHNEDRTVWVTFNGEIFNYLELRGALEARGHRFYTHSDTEVIVHLYEDHGADFVHHLNGQFAIALWDSARRRLLLARDRLGIRPLFYALHGGRLVFGSEIKALLHHPDSTRRLDPEALAQIFTFWAPLGAHTPFEGIRSLPAGHRLIHEQGGTRIERYWDWRFDEVARDVSAQESAERLRELLVDAVRLQLRADVPVGAYLSGGLDSSVIVSLIRHFTTNRLRTFSITFEDEEFDESDYQQELVRTLGCEHTAVRCSRDAIGAAFPRTVWHTEAPILRTAPVPLMLLSQAVRANDYKVVLTGEGADEVFAGYDLFREAKIRRFWAREPRSAARPLLLERLYPYLRHSPAAARAYTMRFFGQGFEHKDAPFFGHVPRWLTTQRTWRLFSPELRERTRAFDPYRAIETQLPADIGRWEPLARDQYLEAHTLLTGYLLSSQGDRVAMANSVEGRFPFLDHRVVEFANRLPALCKLRVLKEKHVLKQAASGLVPERIRRRSKQPYRAPDSQSFFHGGRPADYVAELLGERRLREAGYFDPGAARLLIEKCRRGEAIGFGDNMAFVGMLSTMLLHHFFVEGAALDRSPAGDWCAPAALAVTG
jgi:asparagine synthase (glutamine-hydrolysing)